MKQKTVIETAAINVLLWIAAIIIFLFAFGMATKLWIVPFLAFSLMGLLIFPPLSPYRKAKFPFLSNSYIKGVLLFALFILAVEGTPGKDEKEIGKNEVQNNDDTTKSQVPTEVTSVTENSTRESEDPKITFTSTECFAGNSKWAFDRINKL